MCSLNGALWEQETGTGNTYAPGRPARTPIFFWDVVAHRRTCFLEFWINFLGFHWLQKRVFRRRLVADLTNLCSGSRIFDKCMCHVCHDVCGVWGEDQQVGHCEDKSFCRFKSTLYSSSRCVPDEYSTLLCALSNLSIPYTALATQFCWLSLNFRIKPRR